MEILNFNNKNRYYTHVFLLLIIHVFTCSCTPNNILSQEREMIVYNGSTIKAHNDVSLIIITADGLNRTIIWNGKSVEVKMKPREKPWRGQLGLLSDEIIQTSDKNLVIVNMQESKLFFADINSFIDWKNKYFDSKKGVYRDDGLYVKWFSSENNQGKQALDISIWQIMIDNNKPSKLPGSKNLNLTYEDRL